ncbi:hypothetical protein LXL04_004117 [Taraxacum kok-saghyz]
MQKRKAEGLCYNCPAVYKPGHQCTPPKFLLLQSSNDPPWPYNLGLEDKACFEGGRVSPNHKLALSSVLHSSHAWHFLRRFSHAMIPIGGFMFQTRQDAWAPIGKSCFVLLSLAAIDAERITKKPSIIEKKFQNNHGDLLWKVGRLSNNFGPDAKKPLPKGEYGTIPIPSSLDK